MATKIKGTVKWFSNKKGFGFITPSSDNAPTKDDIFVHQSNIVSDAEYRTLKDGFEVEFEAITDDNGKLKAQNVTSADGTPCPGPDPKERRGRRKKGPKKSTESGDEADATTDDDEKPADSGEEKGEKKPRNRRRRKNGKKSTPGEGETGSGGEQAPKEPKKTWYTELEATVQESMTSRSIKVDAGRAFVAIGDARIKLGTGGYLALAHKKGLLAEGKYTCDPQGKVVATWEHVLKYDAEEWKPATVDEEKDSLVAEIVLTDDSVTPTAADETTETLWGEGKKDPKDILESNGFLMRKVALNPSAGGGRRGRGRRNQGRKNNGENKPAAAPAE